MILDELQNVDALSESYEYSSLTYHHFISQARLRCVVTNLTTSKDVSQRLASTLKHENFL
jgi:hypothetical protein